MQRSAAPGRMNGMGEYGAGTDKLRRRTAHEIAARRAVPSSIRYGLPMKNIPRMTRPHPNNCILVRFSPKKNMPVNSTSNMEIPVYVEYKIPIS